MNALSSTQFRFALTLDWFILYELMARELMQAGMDLIAQSNAKEI